LTLFQDPSVLCTVVSAFYVWCRHRVHRQNVDRVCTMVERVAQQGGQKINAAEALRAVQLLPYPLRRPNGLEKRRHSGPDDIGRIIRK
jgi:hypothetical protein